MKPRKMSASDLFDIEGGTQPPKSEFYYAPGPGLVRFVQIRDFDTDEHPTYIKDSARWRKCLPDDTLIARYGASVGRICRGLGGAYNVALTKVVPKPGVDADYLHYLLKSEYFQGPLLLASARSAQAGFNKEDIRVIELPVLPGPQQKLAGRTLRYLDDKIDLSWRTSETLQAIAQTIFRDWFVDFGPVRRKLAGERDPVAIMGGLAADAKRAAKLAELFPDELGEDELPKGWIGRPLDQIAEFLNGLALQKFPAIAGQPALPVIKIAELRNGLSANTDRASTDIPDKYVVRDGDFIFSWSGSLMARVWDGGDGALNQHLFKVTSTSYPQWFYALWVQHHMTEFRQIAASKATTMGHIQRGHLATALTVCPPQSTLNQLSEIVTPLWSRQLQGMLENRALAETRDYLLPRLMSGKVRVADAAEAAP